MNKETFVQTIVTMVVNNGDPAHFFSQSGAQMAMGEMARKVGVSLAKDNVSKYVMAAAQKLKERMKEELKDRLNHLKFDCAKQQRPGHHPHTVHTGHKEPAHCPGPQDSASKSLGSVRDPSVKCDLLCYGQCQQHDPGRQGIK